MTESVADTFRLFDTSIVSDALDEHGIDGVITGIEPAHPNQRAVGRASTLRFERVDEPRETNFPFAMLHELAADRVLAIDGVGPELSCWGGNASRLAANAGVSGVVVDGGYRDVPEVHGGEFPVFARGPTPKTGQRRVTVEGIGEPIAIDGVTVAPGDVIVADATGVVVVPADEAAVVAETAEGILGEELLLEAKIDAGATVPDLQRDGHAF
ncbi:RraA family protein [Natronorarus salvus]|uniref:RraA family protein n=1 Tax=Natronorarus salvus TaxID=3117733 RepID=UPI002F26C45A